MSNRSYITGFPEPVIVTDAAGIVTLLPGFPIFENVELEAGALAASFVNDTDTIYGGVIEAEGVSAQNLLPALIATDDAINTAAVIPASKTLAPSRVNDIPDSLFLPNVDRVKPPKEARLRPGYLGFVDTVFAPALLPGPVFAQPGLVADDDAVGSADVGWKLFADAPVTDLDGFYTDIRVHQIIFPDRFGDESLPNVIRSRSKP